MSLFQEKKTFVHFAFEFSLISFPFYHELIRFLYKKGNKEDNFLRDMKWSTRD